MHKVAELNYDEHYGVFYWTFGESIVWLTGPASVAYELEEMAGKIKKDIDDQRIQS